MKRLLFLHKQAKTKICLKTMLQVGKPLEKLFQTFNDVRFSFNGFKKKFLLINLIIPNTIRSINNNYFLQHLG